MNRVTWVVLVVPALAVAAPAQKPAPSGAKLAAKPTKRASKPSAFVAKAKLARQHAIDTSTLTAGGVGKKIESSYLAGVEACFQSRLDAGVRGGGNVEVAFVVTPQGKTSEPSVKSFDDALTACVKSKVGTWTFATPRRDGAPASSAFELQFALDARDAKQARAAELAREQTEAQRIADAFSSSSSGDGNTLRDSMLRPDAYLSAQLGSGGGNDVKVGRGQGTARAIDGGAKSAKGHVAFLAKTAFDDTTLSADAVASKIASTYLAGIKRCYQARLDVDHEQAGKLALAFTVTAEGRTTSLSGHGSQLDDSLVKCVTAAAASWRFPVPRHAGDATSAAFAIELSLAAN